MPEFKLEEVELVLADDEIANRMVASGNLGIILEDEDEEKIHEAEDGEEALAKVDELQEGEGPLIVMLDLHMPPGIGGEEVARQLREKWDDLKRKPYLVCCSAEVVEDLKLKPWADRFHHFAAKPLLTDVAEAMLNECKEWYEAGADK